MTKVLILFLLLFVLRNIANAATTDEADAIAIVHRSIAAMGGSAGPQLLGTVATGKVLSSFSNGSPTATVTFKTGRPGQFHVEIMRDGNARSTTYNAGRGATRDNTGQVEHLRDADVFNRQPYHLPLIDLLSAISDPEVHIRLAGEETINGQETWHLEFERSVSNEPGVSEWASILARRQVYIDKTSTLVMLVRYEVATIENLLDHRTMEFEYSDYRRETGLQVPHKIIQRVAGTQVAEFEITRFSVNPALGDADFQLPEVQ